MRIHLEEVKEFEPISLTEMDNVALLDRTDTKYILSLIQLKEILQRITNDYRILDINGERQAKYKTLYFDTTELKFYNDHHNGKANRHKVRIRSYVDSDLCFLEIKLKNNKGRTIKKRIKREGFELNLSNDSKGFISKVMGQEIDLTPSLWNSFARITLVSKKDRERATIDLGLSFEYEGNTSDLKGLVIIEVKQTKASRDSSIVKSLKDLHIRTGNLSKYAIGKALLTEGVKRNNFKRKILAINKITNGIN